MARFQKGKPRPRKAGRKKGTPNKTTVAAKVAMVQAFADLGGVEALVNWARRNKTEFYRLWSKLLPRELDVKGVLGTVAMPDLSNLTDDDLAQLDSICDRAAARSAAAAGGEGGAGPA